MTRHAGSRARRASGSNSLHGKLAWWRGALLIAVWFVGFDVGAADVFADTQAFTPALQQVLSRAAQWAGLRVTVRAGSEEEILRAVARGEARIGVLSRELQGSAGAPLTRRLLGYDGVAVVVNGRNPVDTLTVSQVSAIYAREIRRWRDVGGTDRHVVRLLKDAGVGRAPFGGPTPAREAGADVHVVNGDLATVLFVAVDPLAIGYISLGAAKRLITEGVRVKWVRLDDVEPSAENIRRGNYRLAWPLYLVYSDAADAKTRRMVKRLLGPRGEQLLKDAGLLPAHGGVKR